MELKSLNLFSAKRFEANNLKLYLWIQGNKLDLENSSSSPEKEFWSLKAPVPALEKVVA